MTSPPPTPKPLHPEHLTWTSLLGHWMNFAKTAVALPKYGDGPRWKASVPAIITLQAVTFALAELEMISLDERLLALDRAEILIRDAVKQLDDAWGSEKRSELLTELVDDALKALTTARTLAAANENPRSTGSGVEHFDSR